MTAGMMTLPPTIVDEPMDFTVIATNPSAMEQAQRSLILWAARKIQQIKGELGTAQEQFKLHQEKKWGTHGWRAQILKHERRADFYRKIKAALEAGYYIVPPFPIDVFAIRTDRKQPHRYDSTNSRAQDQPAKALAIGEGRYVDPRPINSTYTENERRGDKLVPATHYYATEYQEADFPFKLARAEIREATDKALSLKVFDQLGVLPRKRAPDPIVCGQILIPDRRFYRYSNPGERDAVTFFVAWWLDTKTL